MMYPYGRFLSRKTITFDDSTGTISVFTVTGNVITSTFAVCVVQATSVGGAGFAVADPTTGNNHVWPIANPYVANVEADWWSGGDDWYPASLPPVPSPMLVSGADIEMVIDGQIDTGTFEFYCFWTPLSADGAVSDVVDDRIDAALPDAAPGAAGGLFIAGTNAATKISTASGHALECVTTESGKHGIYAKGSNSYPGAGICGEGWAGVYGGGSEGIVGYGTNVGIDGISGDGKGIWAQATGGGDGFRASSVSGVDVNADLPKVDLVDAPNATALTAINTSTDIAACKAILDILKTILANKSIENEAGTSVTYRNDADSANAGTQSWTEATKTRGAYTPA